MHDHIYTRLAGITIVPGQKKALAAFATSLGGNILFELELQIDVAGTVWETELSAWEELERIATQVASGANDVAAYVMAHRGTPGSADAGG